MLILSRRVGEEIVIGRDIRVRVTKVHGNRVRLAVEAPAVVPIHRGEIFTQRELLSSGDAAAGEAALVSVEPTLESQECLP